MKSCQCFRDIVKHGYMYSLSCVVPIKIHAKVSLSVPVMRVPVVFAEDGGKMFGVFAAYIFYSKGRGGIDKTLRKIIGPKINFEVWKL